jgi:hypothetical protein
MYVSTWTGQRIVGQVMSEVRASSRTDCINTQPTLLACICILACAGSCGGLSTPETGPQELNYHLNPVSINRQVFRWVAGVSGGCIMREELRSVVISPSSGQTAVVEQQHIYFSFY